jgi:surface polysaccharide O-acyltransferase-like enzyme
MLLCCHAADPFYAAAAYASSGASTDPELVQWGTRWGSLVRPCVPLFVMLTGVLSLPVKGSMESFYQKRIPRVLFPFLIWSVLYYMTPWFTGLLGLDSSVVIKLFSWAESDSQSLADGLDKVIRIPYAFNFIACHMWYIYMLIGLYLYLPIFSAWVERATKRQKEIVLGLWALSTFLPYFTEYVSKYAFGTCEWNSFGLFYYFAGFNGYMLLGHYIQQYVNWNWTKTLSVSLPLLVIGFLITYSGYTYIMELPDKTPEQVELFWTYNTPNVAMMTIACFLLVYRIRISPDSRFASWLASLTTCGFGIYMIHYYFVCLGYDMGEWFHIPAPLRIPFSALIILACSWIIVFFAKKVLGKRSVYLLG